MNFNNKELGFFNSIDSVSEQLQVIDSMISKYKINEKELIDFINKELCRNFENKNYEQVLQYFRISYKIKGILPWKCYAYTRLSARNLFSKKPNEAYNYWLSCSSDQALTAYDISNNIFQKSDTKDNICKKYSKLLTQIVGKEWIKYYSNAFDIILNSIFNPLADSINCELHNFRAIVVSGMGWSGSSAVYDYLREFSSIYPVLGGELSIIEEKESFLGLTYIIDNWDKNLDVIDELVTKWAIEFFFINLLGCYPIIRDDVYKQILFYRKFNIKDPFKYAEGVIQISSILSNLIIYAKKRDLLSVNKTAKLLATAILNIATIDAPNNKIPLLDNAIHFRNLQLIKYFDSVDLICVERDPRSIFVSQLEERADFDNNIVAFTNSQIANRELLSQKKESLDENSAKRCSFIKFEDFVLSSNFRSNLVEKLELDSKTWTERNKFFIPENSSKNVINFLNDVHTKEIQYIYENMKEYCLDYLNETTKPDDN